MKQMNFLTRLFTVWLFLSMNHGCKKTDRRQATDTQDLEAPQPLAQSSEGISQTESAQRATPVSQNGQAQPAPFTRPVSEVEKAPGKPGKLGEPVLSLAEARFFKKPCLMASARLPQIRNDLSFTKETQVFLAALFAGTEKQGKEALRLELDAVGYNVAHWIDNPSRGVFGYLAIPKHEQGYGIVVFGGTQDLFGVLADSQFATKRADGRDLTGLISFKGLKFRGWMHTGFYDSYLSISDALEEALAKLATTKSYGFYFTGHSYGGALATIAAARNTQAGRKTLGLLTAGQPRIGDAELAAHFSELLGQGHLRIVHESDLVAHLPPTAQGAEAFSAVSSALPGVGFISEKSFKIAGYVHSGVRRHLSAASELIEEKSDAASDLQKDQEFWLNSKESGLTLFNLQQAKQVTDHDAQSYFCGLAHNWLNTP